MSNETEVRAQDGTPEGEGGYVASAQELERAEQAVKELAALGMEVHVVKKWWGFEVHLNAEAAVKVAEITSYIGQIADAALTPLIGSLVRLFCEIRAFVITEIGRHHGCKLVSPWIAPGMLIPLSKGPKDDANLYWTVFEPGGDKGWSEDTMFAAHGSAAHPALAVFRDKLYCVHRGQGVSGEDADLWWTVYDPAAKGGWSPDTKFPAHGSHSGPTLAVFNNKLYCAHRGNKDPYLWLTSFDGTQWSPDRQIPSSGSTAGPALTVFKGRLYMAFKGHTDSDIWVTSTADGQSWTSPKAIPQHGTAASPALAVYKDKLYCVTRGGYDADLWWTASTDGNSWTSAAKFPAHGSREGVGLAVFQDKLYCLHRGHSDQDLWWTAFDGTRWSSDVRLPAHRSAGGPAVVVYRDPNGTRDQLLVVHRGAGAKSAAFDINTDDADELQAAETPTA
ncbi:sialidase family protein [Streptomyces goshikiensis]|uniref:sialidase family protein n=1 Tax=Streptomyces goshikiensis TaxID=1942 RepID=UPI0036B7564C